MNRNLLLVAILIPILAIAEDACRSTEYGYDLSPLTGSSDRETPSFAYLSLDWVIVYNFCRATRRTCMWTHFPAFMNAPDDGLRCTPTLTSGEWLDAKYAAYKNKIGID